MTNNNRLEEIEGRLSKATPGPWGWDGHVRRGLVAMRQATPILQCSALLHPTKTDAEFIAAAPADVAYLLAELRKAQDKLARVEQVVSNIEYIVATDLEAGTPLRGAASQLRAAVADATGGGE